MSIATEITRLQNAKSAIKTSIEGKGVTVPSTTTLDGYSTLIDSISSGTNSWTKLGETNITTASTSTSNANIGSVSCGSAASTKDKIIYVRVRDTAGPRAGYFLGSDTFFVNTNKANGSTSAMSTAARLIHRYTTSSQYGAYSGTYGVYAYSITNAGTVNIYRRYNSTNSLTIDGTYHVEVYSLDYPDGESVFDI